MFNPPRIAVLIFCLVIGAVLSILMGQDASWDLRNYHLYNPFALMTGRYDLDFFPADKQTFNNPLLDLPYAYLALGPLAHYPRLIAALMGLPFGLLVYVVWRLTERLLQSRDDKIVSGLVTLTAMTGAMCWSQIGSTSHDVTIGMMVLAGLLCVVRGIEKQPWMIGGGVLFGLAAGLKLTGGVYAPALVIALMLALPLRVGLRSSTLFTGGWVAGFGASYGWWGWFLWKHFANPVFPLFNDIFKSPLAPADSLRDLRFLPHDLWGWIFYPFRWAFNSDAHPVYETAFRDPRMAIGFAVIMVFAFLAYRKREKNLLTPSQKIALYFLIFSYAAWLTTSSILRYAVAIEALSVVVTMMLMQRIIDWQPRIIAAAVCLSCLLLTQHPVWERRDFQDTMYNVDLEWVPKNAMFLGLYQPMAYLAAFTPTDKHTQFVGLNFVAYLGDTELGQKGRKMITEHQGPVMVVFEDAMRSFLPILHDFGFSPNVTDCRTINANLAMQPHADVYACVVKREP